jgi:hypothetical protein
MIYGMLTPAFIEFAVIRLISPFAGEDNETIG